MQPLRPIVNLASAAVKVTVTSDKDWAIKSALSDLDYLLNKQGVPMRFRHGDTVSLNGLSVSALVALHKGFERIRKAEAKHDVDVQITYHGEAALLDLQALSKEPTPAEDVALIKKVRNGASLTSVQWARVFVLVGLQATQVKEGRAVVGFTVEFPGQACDTYKIGYGSLRPPLGHKASEEDFNRYAEANAWLEGAASELLGLPSPRQGVPARARDYRTDLTIRTCPVCFRDIRASGHTGGLMAEHGFTIRPGYRTGSCPGTSRLPWEIDSAPVHEEITSLLKYSAKMEQYLKDLQEGVVTKITAEVFSMETHKHQKQVLTPEDAIWGKALKTEIQRTQRVIDGLWGKMYPSIPWMRMAARTWKQVSATDIAVGAPMESLRESDFEGKPQ